MKKILLSLLIIGATAGAATVAIKTTTSLLSDDEVSANNTFAAGAIDLKVDNSSYYNGQVMATSTWLPADLDNGAGPSGAGKYLYFNFTDLKPGDWGQDTISLHTTGNDAWSCAEIKLTKNDDMSSMEPELADGDGADTPDLWDGELAQNLNFLWWNDDGDNVLEVGEPIMFAPGDQPLTLAQMVGLSTNPNANLKLTLADKQWNAFTRTPATPLTGETDYYLGVGWCFGQMTPAPVAPGANSPLVNPGFTCNGSSLNNITQSDTVMGNLTFTAVQERHNTDFLCPEHN